jgi:two-component system, NtrC family, sensor histidine kinase HydH
VTRHSRRLYARLREVGGIPAGFAEIERAEMARAFGALLYVRVIALPVVVAVMLWYWRTTGRSAARLALIVAMVVLAAAYLAWLFYQRRRRTLDAASVARGILGSTIVVLAASALSGGLGSPFVIVLPVAAAANAMSGGRRQAFTAVAIELAALPLLAVAGGGTVLFGVTMALFILIGMNIGLTMRRMYEAVLMRALHARDDLLRLHVEQLRDLTTLSSEIAHELKTPLASIKGLTGLALVELQDPARAAERLGVLRNEALRMQKLLEEFLNFSRPLSPLSLDAVDARVIAEEVAELFTRPAHERQLATSLSGGSVEVRCDRRKIKQILINLMQNAVEASRPGGEIRIEVEGGPSEARIRVLDRGRGLPAELGERAFHAGVTTKERGAGLGLTIARSIAQQHGGTLELKPRHDGGCVAELVLPRAAPGAMPRGEAA